ncbi:hypothetical protein PR003_g15724 [Phytophthora rubi]|uniref:RxLR effector protein n=1 Tax=Phytophthora rubi TaxID=129364 RepID=A0A6A4EMI0_9STRA|nr:hypothetical protein PR003_g15724 [Phytophthora rubi]
MNSATLLVVVACLNAVTAAHTAVGRVLCPPTSTMMLPLPPGPGLPLEPSSKKAKDVEGVVVFVVLVTLVT